MYMFIHLMIHMLHNLNYIITVSNDDELLNNN